MDEAEKIHRCPQFWRIYALYVSVQNLGVREEFRKQLSDHFAVCDECRQWWEEMKNGEAHDVG